MNYNYSLIKLRSISILFSVIALRQTCTNLLWWYGLVSHPWGGRIIT